MKKICAVALLSTLSTVALAEGAYVAVDVGNSTIKDACAGATTTCSDSDTAYRVGGGMQITPNFGVEANYAKLGSAKASFGSFSAEFKPTALQLSAVIAASVADTVSLFAKLGVSRVSSDFSATGNPTRSTTKTAPSYGFGAQYDFSRQIGIRAQYERLGKARSSTADFDIDMISAGLVFKF